MKSVVYLLGAASALALSAPAAAKTGDPVPIADGVTLDLTLDGRLRYETVDQATLPSDA